MIRVIRLLLCILIIFCGAVVGLHLSLKLTRRREVLLGFEKLFHRARIGIDYSASDVCELFSQNFAGFEFSHSLPFDVQWERFVRQFSSVLSKEDIAVLTEFADGLGTADAVSQQKHIALYGKLLQEQLDSAQESIRTKAKMLRIVPLCIGIVIALLMI